MPFMVAVGKVKPGDIHASFDDLPQNAQDYVLALEAMSNTRISVIGVGPERDEVRVRHALLD